jgi:2-polyprenyl-3-methyl-5-hydroxy-6-metoxy-1,4-benzoquinol methylase
MRIAEQLLMAVSRDPRQPDYPLPTADWDPARALDRLNEVYPQFPALIADKDVLDFGCGTGRQAIAIAQQGARSVVGVDTNNALLPRAENFARDAGVQDRVAFLARLDEPDVPRFDVIISQNSMEHYPDPYAVLCRMKAVLRPRGAILITFTSLWYSPWGTHTQYFTRLPWVNLIFSERTVMEVRKHYRADGANRYEDIAGGLNRMSLRKFEGLIRAAALRVEYRKYEGVKKLDVATRIPLVRELLTNRVTCLLRVGS